MFNRTIISDGHCQSSIKEFPCEDGNYKMGSTSFDFVVVESPNPFHMRIFYELYSKGCYRTLKVDVGLNTVEYFKSLQFPKIHSGPSYCAWYLPVYKYPNDIYLIFFYYKLEKYTSNRLTCWDDEGSLWVTELTRTNQANVIWKRCSSRSTNIEIFKIDGKKSPWISVNFYSPDVKRYQFYAGGFYSEQGCGGVITKGFEKINFSFDNGYGNNRFCAWIFKPEFNQDYNENMITYVIFHNFDLEISYECHADYVRILSYKNMQTGFDENSYFCGEKIPAVQLLRAQNVAIQFKSDHGDFQAGFDLTVIQTWSDCGRVTHVTKAEIFTDKVYVRYGHSKLCSWYFYAEDSFQLMLNVHWKYSASCSNTNLHIYVMSWKNYEKSPYSICKDRKFNIPANNQVLIEYHDFGSSSYNEVFLEFALNINIKQTSSYVLMTSSAAVTSSSAVTSSFLTPTEFTTDPSPSIPFNRVSTSPYSNTLSLSSSRNHTTVVVNGRNKQDNDGKSNFLLYGLIIAGFMATAIAFIVIAVIMKRRNLKSGQKHNNNVQTHEIHDDKEDAVFYEHRNSRVILVNRESTSSEINTDMNPFVNIGNIPKKSFREKLKSSFGKDVVDIKEEWKDDCDSKESCLDGVENKSYEDSGDECELYESNEDHPLSVLPRVSYSRGNPLYSLYGAQPENTDDNDDIFLPKDQTIPPKKEPLKRSEKESVNSLYGAYGGGGESDVPTIPDVDEIKKKNRSSSDENIYAPSGIYESTKHASRIYASSNNPLYGRPCNVYENKPNEQVNQYYVPSEATNIPTINFTNNKRQSKVEPPKIIEEDNYACPDSPAMQPATVQEQEYSYAANPGVPNVEERNMLYGYQEANLAQDNLLYE